ncbi:MAG: ferritin-like domain-containing protein [Acidobacteriota bacterium]
MQTDNKLVEIARRDLLKMIMTTGTAAAMAALSSGFDPALAALVNPQRKGAAASKPAPPKKVDPVANDLGIVNTAIQLEQKAINTYVGMEKVKLIVNKQIIEVARQFAADHMAHRDALIKAANEEFKGTPAAIKGLGTFPIPASILKKEVDAVRYALALEVVASKVYYNAFKDALRTDAGRNLIITILPVETQHIGVFRSVLKLVLKDKQIPENARLVPYAFLEEHPTPTIPEGFSWDFEKLS